MRTRRLMRLLACAMLPGIAHAATHDVAEPVHFDWFDYIGHDAAFDTPLHVGEYRNPILAGFYPDPSIVRAGDKFYLANSSFTYFPGIPIFESDDLVNWRQIGNAIDRATQLDFDGLRMSRGVYAPALSYHDGVFYLLNTAVDAGGNYLMTATNPAGPWSDPVWLKSVGGIDASLFFDDDGRVYLLNNDAPPETPRYDGHRAIWLREFDTKTLQPIGDAKAVIDGGVDPAKNPAWIEGPHLYKRDGWYYLMCAEGGTGPQHSEVVARSRTVWGPYVAYADNPILTQRDLPDARAEAVTNAGHADLVQGRDGSWWAVFLASRNYGGTHYNTGRETYLLPVQWKDGWPTILGHATPIPRIVQAPSWMTNDATQAPLSGNFHWRDEFDAQRLDPSWMQIRVPKTPWADLTSKPGTLTIHPLAESPDTLRNPSYLAHRQQHLAFDAGVQLEAPQRAGVAAGLVTLQNETHWFFLGAHRVKRQLEVFLQERNGETEKILAHATLQPTTDLQLKIDADKGAYSFAYKTDHGTWQWLRRDADGSILSTDVAGGFVGATLGPFARAETASTDSVAAP